MSRFEKCEVRYGLKPVLPSVTSTLDCAGCDMYERNAYAAVFTLSGLSLLTGPHQPPKAAKGAWLTPFVAWGQIVASHATSFPVLRSRTRFEPGRMTEPTLSCTLEVAGSMASVPMSPQSIDRAQRPEVKRPRVSPTSRLSWSGGPSLEIVLYTSSAAAVPSLGPKSGCRLLSTSKNAPCAVPLLCRYAPATEMNIQYDWALRFIARQEP